MFGSLALPFLNRHAWSWSCVVWRAQFGLRSVLLVNNVFFIVGSVLTFFSNMYSLFVGRFICGIGVGVEVCALLLCCAACVCVCA